MIKITFNEKVYSLENSTLASANTSLEHTLETIATPTSYSLRQSGVEDCLYYHVNEDFTCYVSGVNNSEIVEVVIPEVSPEHATITSIGVGAFKDCDYLELVVIPSTVTSIQSRAFFGCSQLGNVVFEGTKSQWEAIEKGEEWAYGTIIFKIQCFDGVVSL